MRLLPRLPFDSIETLISWAARLAGRHTGGRLVPFLNDMGIKGDALHTNRAAAVERLCDLTGEDYDLVNRNAVTHVGAHQRHLRGETFWKEFLNGEDTAFCPACLLDDDSLGDPRWCRRGRLMWRIRSFDTCPVHGLSLVVRAKQKWDYAFQEMTVIVPETGPDLERLVDGCSVRPVSPLQNYIANRLDGQNGPEWLDSQDIDQVPRSAEMIGAALLHGPGANLSDFTRSDWQDAARSGFPAIAAGEAGVMTALDDILGKTDFRGKRTGASRIYGFLFEWCRMRGQKDVGPIRDVIRRHILENLPVEPGSMLFGQPVEARRVHTPGRLAVEFGVHRKTIVKVLNAANGRTLLADASSVARLAEALRSAVAIKHLPKALHCTRPVAQALVQEKVLPQVVQDGQTSTQVGKAVPRDAVDALLGCLAQAAIAPKSDALLPLTKAAEVARVRAVDIIKLILEGKLSHVSTEPDLEGIAALLVDPEEISRFRVIEDLGHVPYKAFDQLKLRHKVGRTLVDRHGIAEPSLRVMKVRTAAGNLVPRILDEDLRHFQSTYASHAELCAATGLHHTAVAQELIRSGVEPVFVFEEFGTRIYRRADLPPSLTLSVAR